MSRINRFRKVLMLAGLVYLIATPVLLTFWLNALLTSLFVYGGMAALVIACVVYFYGFLFWKREP